MAESMLRRGWSAVFGGKSQSDDYDEAALEEERRRKEEEERRRKAEEEAKKKRRPYGGYFGERKGYGRQLEELDEE
jgi:hypothetical protein